MKVEVEMVVPDGTEVRSPRRLTWWGSECMDCGNTTPGSMTCDECGTRMNTLSLWMGA